MKNKKMGYLTGVLILTLAAGIGIAVKAYAAATRTQTQDVVGAPQAEYTGVGAGGAAADSTIAINAKVPDASGKGLYIYGSDGVTPILEVTDNFIFAHKPLIFAGGQPLPIACTAGHWMFTKYGKQLCNTMWGQYRGPAGAVPAGTRIPFDATPVPTNASLAVNTTGTFTMPASPGYVTVATFTIPTTMWGQYWFFNYNLYAYLVSPWYASNYNIVWWLWCNKAGPWGAGWPIWGYSWWGYGWSAWPYCWDWGMGYGCWPLRRKWFDRIRLPLIPPLVPGIPGDPTPGEPVTFEIRAAVFDMAVPQANVLSPGSPVQQQIDQDPVETVTGARFTVSVDGFLDGGQEDSTDAGS